MDEAWAKLIIRHGKYAGKRYGEVRRIDPRYASRLTGQRSRNKLARETFLALNESMGVKHAGLRGAKPKSLTVPGYERGAVFEE